VASLQARHPALDAFLTGVLAVAIASPCTAPFMGASLGLAVGCRPLQALLIFAAMGLGMALPYLAGQLGARRWRALLPRPGAVDGHLPPLMAFPMFATVVWLVWVLGQQSGIDGAGALLALLVALSLVVWALTLQGPHPPGSCYVSIVLLGALLAGAAGQNIVKICQISTRPVSGAASAGRPGHRARWSRSAGHGPAGVCGLHRRLVRDLPVQQENHAGQRRRCWPTGDAKKVALAARRLDPPRPGHHRRAERRWGAMGCRCMCSTSKGVRRWCCRKSWAWTNCARHWPRSDMGFGCSVSQMEVKASCNVVHS
jgi:hypothetical protein